MFQLFNSAAATMLFIGMVRAEGLRKAHYIPKPAGPQITGTLEIESKSSDVPQCGGWIKFNVSLQGIPNGGELPNRSKIVLQTVCEQEFYDTVDITEEYDGSGTYMLHLKDSEMNRGIDKPWKEYYPAICQTKLVYQYKYLDLNDSTGEMDYSLSHTSIYNVDGRGKNNSVMNG